MPDVFTYNDYRAFLRDWYEWKKGVNPRFSYRLLADKVGFKSAGFFTQLLQGKTTMSLDLSHRFAECFGLDRRETEFFVAMVQANQAKSLVEEKRQLDRMMELRPQPLQRLARDRSEFLATWFHTVVWQLLEVLDVREDCTQLAASLVPAIDPAEAIESLLLLERLGMARRQSDGRWRQLDPILSVHREIPQAVTRKFYLSLNKLAAQSHDRFDRDERLLSWVTLSISDDKREEMVEEVRAFRRHLVELARGDGKPQDVHQLLIQLFPLSRTRSTRGARP
ncbi:MAG: TIGR02147 family protein [Fibrobacteres bacterium]|jgi:uncharacterized protein (TIGR02147 family)|nr:TIGR02147 family protein [Fibrobacterota bacterium]